MINSKLPLDEEKSFPGDSLTNSFQAPGEIISTYTAPNFDPTEVIVDSADEELEKEVVEGEEEEDNEIINDPVIPVDDIEEEDEDEVEVEVIPVKTDDQTTFVLVEPVVQIEQEPEEE